MKNTNLKVNSFMGKVQLTILNYDLTPDFITEKVLNDENIIINGEKDTSIGEFEDLFQAICSKVITGIITLNNIKYNIKVLIPVYLEFTPFFIVLEKPDKALIRYVKRIFSKWNIEFNISMFSATFNFFPMNIEDPAMLEKLYSWLCQNTYLNNEDPEVSEKEEQEHHCTIGSFTDTRIINVFIQMHISNGQPKFPKLKFNWIGYQDNIHITKTMPVIKHSYFQKLIAKNLYFNDPSFQQYFYHQLNRASLI